MAVSIQIVVDDGQTVQVVEAGSDNLKLCLAEILEAWKRQAAEPCAAGQKCKVLQQWIEEIENLL